MVHKTGEQLTLTILSNELFHTRKKKTAVARVYVSKEQSEFTFCKLKESSQPISPTATFYSTLSATNVHRKCNYPFDAK
jgi:hypothetical protein